MYKRQLQLRPFQVADGATAIRALRRCFSLAELGQDVVAQALHFQLRDQIAAMRFGKGRVKRQALRFALDFKRGEVRVGSADAGFGAAATAQRNRDAADPGEVCLLYTSRCV